MLHGKKLAVVIAYDLYLECCEGKIEPEWKIEKPVDFHRFREKLGLQMLTYTPANKKYPGDEKLRAFTKLPIKRRLAQMRSPARSCSNASGVSSDYLQEQSNKGRLCGFLGQLNDHIASVKSLPNGTRRNCAVCGEKAYQECRICKISLHYSNPPKNEAIKVPCFFLYHDTGFCGLARSDCQNVGTPKKSWTMADQTSVSSHQNSIKTLQKSMKSNSNSQSEMSDSGEGNNDDGWNDQCV